MSELIEFQRQAVDELEELDPPADGQKAVEMLIEALRERTETFEQVIAAGRFTQLEFAQITESGEKIDEAFEQLRNEGFLPKVDVHEEDQR